MALPTRDDMLAKVDVRFRELAPGAPLHLDPDNPAHAEMIRQWWAAHHEVLSKMTDDAFFEIFPTAPRQLDPGDASHAKYIGYWRDMSQQIDSGKAGRWDWANPPTSVVGIDEDAIEIEGEEEYREPVPQDGSVQLEDRIGYIRLLLEQYVEAVVWTSLGMKVLEHTNAQIEVLRGLVRDGTFKTYDHVWRSLSYSDAIWDDENKDEQLAFVRDLTVEAQIDRKDGVLNTNLSGWASDLKRNDSWFGRESIAKA